MPARENYPPIKNYGIIGDCRSAALVSRDGSIDWLCLARFDSASIFAAILDPENGGRFRIKPIGPFETVRRYVPDTNVLETAFRCPTGLVILRDLMPVASEDEKSRKLMPDHEVLREIEAVEGEVDLEILYQPRPEYGRLRPFLRSRGNLGWWSQDHGAALALLTDCPLQAERDASGLSGTLRIRAGEHRYLSFLYSHEGPAILAGLGEEARARVERSIAWWRDFAGRCTYRGAYRDMVVRSLLVLKLMAYAPSGAIVAAPTTSLPERIGGDRNWDYRFCWLRDASFMLQALFGLGYFEEGDAFLDWLVHATRLTWPKLQVMYSVFGQTDAPERTLPHLRGYADSRPVRIGNSARDQIQLDVYGEVLDAVFRFSTQGGGRFDADTQKMLTGLGRTVCQGWEQPDEGIWELRSGRFQHTHSKVLCWVALDRLIRLHEAGSLRLSSGDYATFDQCKARIRSLIEERGFNDQLGSYVRTLDGDELDASLLLLPLYRYIEADHPRMRSTMERIENALGHGSLIRRYALATDDGLTPGEGAFAVCSFWAIQGLAMRGEWEEARRRFEEMLTYANDLGLFSEEVDPQSGDALGNFPQVFTHVGLIDAALALTANRREG
jgi:GH15 family glucan-1,4-alpha-glucosidase